MSPDEILVDVYKSEYNKAVYFVMGNRLVREDAEDIFMESLIVLKKKYTDTLRVLSPKDGRRVLYGIMKIQILSYRRKRADEVWLQESIRTTEEQQTSLASATSQMPPSYWYRKKYENSPERKERDRIRKRLAYQKNPRKFRERAKANPKVKQRSRVRYKLIRSDPVKHEQYLAQRREQAHKRKLAKLVRE